MQERFKDCFIQFDDQQSILRKFKSYFRAKELAEWKMQKFLRENVQTTFETHKKFAYSVVDDPSFVLDSADVMKPQSSTLKQTFTGFNSNIAAYRQ